jgi:mono/diheme cytochrome c family protein
LAWNRLRGHFAVLIVGLLLFGAGAQAQTPAERGAYLVNAVGACGNCHTPKGPQGDLPGLMLSGNWVVEDNPAFRAVSANITPDLKTGVGSWTDAQLVRAIREGIRPDGSLIGPPMPFAQYRRMADDDVFAIVAYLRTVPPVESAAEKSSYHIPLPPAYGPPIDYMAAPSRADAVAYGAYVAGPLGHCMECHTPMLPGGRRDVSRIGAGGQEFHGPWGGSVAANLTSSRESGLGAWSDAEIERAIRTGVSRNGRALFPPMGFAYYRNISETDMAALIAYLRSLPPVER